MQTKRPALTVKSSSELLKLLRMIPTDVANRLTALALPHVERGVLPSEMLAFCAFTVSLEVLRIIESGRWLGYSTETIAAYFKDTGVRIDSIDYFRTNIGRECEKRLRDHTNINLYYGDAFHLLPGMLALSDTPTVLLIDGPKGAPAVRLIESLMDTYPHLLACFLHDSYLGSESRSTLDTSSFSTAYTDDPVFLERFSYLDAGIPIGTIHPEKYSGTTVTFPTKSYGPTLAIIYRASPHTGNPVSVSERFKALVWLCLGRLSAWIKGRAYVLRTLVRK